VPGLSVSGGQLGPLRLGTAFTTSRRLSDDLAFSLTDDVVDVWWSILVFPMVERDNSGGVFFNISTTMGQRVLVGLTVSNGTWRLTQMQGSTVVKSSSPLNPARIYAVGEPCLIVARCRWRATTSDDCQAELFGRFSSRLESNVTGGPNITFSSNELTITRLSVQIKNWQLSEIRIGSTFRDVAFDMTTPAPSTTTTTRMTPRPAPNSELSFKPTTTTITTITTTTTETQSSTQSDSNSNSVIDSTTQTTTITVVEPSSSSTLVVPSSSTAQSSTTTLDTVANGTLTSQSESLNIITEPPSNAMGIGIGVGAGVMMLIGIIVGACVCLARRNGRKHKTELVSDEPIVAPPKPAREREESSFVRPAESGESERASFYGQVPPKSDVANPDQEYEMLTLGVDDRHNANPGTIIYAGMPPRPQYSSAPRHVQG
jgi:hypothetical protein